MSLSDVAEWATRHREEWGDPARKTFRFSVLTTGTEPRPSPRDRAESLPPPLALYAAARRTPPRRNPRWLVPVLVVALVLASGVAAAAYWPFPRPVATAPLAATIDINRTSGPHPFLVSVEANVSGGSPPYQYAWTFGDGGFAVTASATHQYSTHGNFQVLLRVTDHQNRTASAGVTVTVNPVHEELTVLNASNQTLGAGESKAWIVPITLPTTAVSARLQGTVNVTACSLGDNCLAYVEVLNVHDETNLTQGGAITNPIWCLLENGSCQANQTTAVDINLARYSGDTVYLVVFNTDLVWSQTVSARVYLNAAY
jgi:PKD domain